MGQALRTPLCEALGIEYPIFSVGMGPLAGPDLVAAVSNAGGCGVLGTSGMQPDQIARRVAGLRQLTKKPFGANFIIDEVGWATSEEDRAFARSGVAAAIAERVTLSFFSGVTQRHTSRSHAAPV